MAPAEPLSTAAAPAEPLPTAVAPAAAGRGDVLGGHRRAAAAVATTESEERKLVVVSELENKCRRMEMFANSQEVAIQARLVDLKDDAGQEAQPQRCSDATKVMSMHVEASLTEDPEELTDAAPAAVTTQLYSMQSICRWCDQGVAECCENYTFVQCAKAVKAIPSSDLVAEIEHLRRIQRRNDALLDALSSTHDMAAYRIVARGLLDKALTREDVFCQLMDMGKG